MGSSGNSSSSGALQPSTDTSVSNDSLADTSGNGDSAIVTDAEGHQWLVVSDGDDYDYFMTPDGYVISDPTDDNGERRNDLLLVRALD